MKDIKKLFSLVAIGIFLIAMVGCSDHGHSHDEGDGHSHTTHETIK